MEILFIVAIGALGITKVVVEAKKVNSVQKKKDDHLMDPEQWAEEKSAAANCIEWCQKSLESNHPLDIKHRKSWFNDAKKHQMEELKRNFQRMGDRLKDVQLRSVDGDACEKGAPAFIKAAAAGLGTEINVCPLYSQYNIQKKVEALLHELSHLINPEIGDWTYDITEARRLKPVKAIRNAFNYQKFGGHFVPEGKHPSFIKDEL
eukprot:CAMPEP_0201575048 /NCGR_PEP_ID=MMETSP0190_2-20130828/19982_1 /ASSEMBLY_ACC=CAM_ASM_000263 /TAXON_ID=37353 /ORGANISM="Rosalina sp." /LENGTH=204 /DNA_ID=CAMNT_0048004173 /DNA_START=28 /DNA_END=642 /DNA_ORIENTATION=-